MVRRGGLKKAIAEFLQGWEGLNTSPQGRLQSARGLTLTFSGAQKNKRREHLVQPGESAPGGVGVGEGHHLARCVLLRVTAGRRGGPASFSLISGFY